MLYVLVVAMGVGALFATFSAIRFEWPESYHTLGNSSAADFAISASPVKYFAFRIGPGFIVGLFVAVTAERLKLELPRLLGALPIGIHTMLTNGRAAMAVWSRPVGSRRGPLLLMQLAVGAVVVAVGLAGAFLAPWLDGLVPEVEQLVSDMWTAGFAAVAAVAVMRATSSNDNAFEVALIQSYRRIEPQLFRYALRQATQHGTDPRLVWTLMVVENLQRPKWFRAIENRVGRLLPNRTTGLLQVINEEPLDDRESIDVALDRHLRGAQIQRSNSGYPDYESAKEAFMLHNPDENYGDLCALAMHLLSERFETDFADDLHDLEMGED